MKTIECTCKNCGKIFQKPQNEYNRKIKNNSVFYCSRECSGFANLYNFKDKRNNIPPKNTRKANPFKYYLRNCKKRGHDVNIDLQYLEDLWNSQDGICPFSKVKLILNTHSLRVPDFRYTASLDRIDSSKGYIKGNVQFISTCINYMKNTMTDEQIKDFLQEIAKNLS